MTSREPYPLTDHPPRPACDHDLPAATSERGVPNQEGHARRPLQPGDTVRVRGERWRVMYATGRDRCTVVELAGAEPSNAGRTDRFLLPFEPAERLPRVLDRPRAVGASAWRRVARAALADATPTWTSLRTAARARLTLLPYQLEPALAMTRGLACRVLLADEVGLGKTIQAGLMIAELIARERESRVLIVTPASLREQWREELHERFAIDAAVIDASALARSAAHLPSGVNPWSIPHVVIASIDFLKRPDVIRALEALVWDLVAFDEAHALSGRTDRAAAAQLLASRGRRVVTITATPHNGDEGAFERLCTLGRLEAGDHVLIFRRSRAETGISRARAMRLLEVRPTREEAQMHRALASYAARVSRDAPPETAAAARLAMIVLARRACSSSTSLARSIERRIGLLASAPGGPDAQLSLPLDEGYIGEDDEPLEELAARGLSDGEAERRWLERILLLARSVRAESKCAAVARLLRRTGEPAIVFTEYRDTLRHVASSLSADAATLHGGLTTAERAREARRFTHGSARLLLATDAASEGLNLHHRCRLVVNLDVPWSPLRLEQRVGRVDRLGQLRRVHAVTLVARDTVETKVAAALAARSAQAERGAPFGTSNTELLNLRAAGDDEAARLATARTMIGARRHPGDRPVLAVLPLRPRMARFGRASAELWLALRLLFVDSTGAIVWDTVAGAALGCPWPAGRASRAIQHWFDRAIDGSAVPLAAASWAHHQKALLALRSELREAVAPLLARERAILEQVTLGHARLAAPLIQPGLFDRRAIRNAGAQRRIAEEAAAVARERLEQLACLAEPSAGERHLVFAVTRSR